MTASERDQIVGEIERLQNLLDELQARLSALAAQSPTPEDARDDVLAQASVDEAYAQLEIAKRIPSADAWKAIQNATSAVGRLAGSNDARRPSGSPYAGPIVRLTLFVSQSGPSLRALATVQDVVKRLGDRVSVDVSDVSRDPDRAERAGVVFTPVLRLERAGLDTVTIFGALDDHARLLRRLVHAGLPLDEAVASSRSRSEVSTASVDGVAVFSGAGPTTDTD
jgi:hypothetical protein